jgi:predicted dehydrogenase
MTRLRIGVIGVGHLGKEHARILSGMDGIDLVGVVDANAIQAAAVAVRCSTQPYTDFRALLPLVDAAVVVVPTLHHQAVAAAFLDAEKPVLVEKPLTADLGQADDLVARAARRRLTLQVGHIERFNPAFEELQRHPLQPRYIRCERAGGFTGRSTDVGVVLDLMIHDLDLVRALVTAPVTSVTAIGTSVLGGYEDMVQARLTFADGCIADLSVSRVHPEPLRRLQVWGPEGYASADLATRKLTLTQPGDALRSGGLDPRRLDAAGIAALKAELFGTHLQTLELECQNPADQLTRELQDFVQCVKTGARPRVDGQAGREAVALANAVLISLKTQRHPDAKGLLFTPPAAASRQAA